MPARLLLSIALLLVGMFRAGPVFAGVGDLAELLGAFEQGSCAADIDRLDGPSRPIVAAAATRCWLGVGEPDAALAAWRHVERDPRAHVALRPAFAWFAEVEARVLLLRGEASVAAAAFDGLLDASSSTPTTRSSRARWLYYGGLAHQAMGDEAGAIARWERLQQEFPASEYLSRIWLVLPSPQASAAIRVELAARALEGRHYEAADRLLRHAACSGRADCSPYEAVHSGDPSRYEAAWQLGFLLYRFRRELVAESIPWLDAVASVPGPRQADALFVRARAAQRLERNAEARRAWAEAARRFPDAPDAAVAEAHVAWLLLDNGDLHAARAAWDRIAARAIDAPARRAALRWAAWAAFRAGDCAAAESRWRVLQAERGAWWSGQASYWIGVCRERVGDAAAARVAWQRVVSEFPENWYALLARRRLGELPSSLPPARALTSFGSATLDEAAALGRSGYDDAARALIALDPAAAVAMERLDPLRRAALAAAVEPGPATWRRGRVDDPSWGDVDAFRRSFPPFWNDLVQATATRYGLPAVVLHGVMQQESAFDRNAVSVSDAMGLMQVIPQTALRISITLDVAYSDGALFEPTHALHFGGWYLSALKAKFGGQLPLAIAAYNAGPVLVEAWLDRYGDVPLDEFVESIPADQTRDYVKRVTTIAFGRAVASGESAFLADPELAGLLPERVIRGYDDSVPF